MQETDQQQVNLQLRAAGNEVQALTRQTADLGRRIDRWNTGMICALVFTVLAALAVLVTTMIIVKRSRKLNDLSGDLVSAKDRQVSLELAAKDLQLQILRNRADTAEGAISENNKVAKQAQATAELERLRRVELEAKIAPRRLSLEEQQKIGTACVAMYGRKLHIESYANDPEGAIIALQIADAFLSARITPSTLIGQVLQAGAPEEGIQVRGAAEDEAFLHCVANALINIGHLEKVAVNGPRRSGEGASFLSGLRLIPNGPFLAAGPLPPGSEVTISVGVKPFDQPSFIPFVLPQKP